MRQAFPFLFLTDDGGLVYRRRAYEKACELIKEHGITTVFSSFRPWSDHLVAAKLKKRFPDVHWIADFRDLPVDRVRNDIWWPALQTWWGKKVISAAGEIWVVSEGQQQQLSDWHPRIKVVRNALRMLPKEEIAPVTERFSIVYTGSLYPDLQSMKPLVEAIQYLLAKGSLRVENLSLVYRGKDQFAFLAQTKSLPPEILDVQPPIAPAAAHDLQHNGQLLLLLNWSAPGYYGVLTAKLWDYLASGRPILALVNGPADPELKDIIGGANAGAVFSKNEQREVINWLEMAYTKWEETGSLPWAVNRENLKQYLQ